MILDSAKQEIVWLLSVPLQVFNDPTITSGNMMDVALALIALGIAQVPPNLDIVANDLDLIVTQGE